MPDGQVIVRLTVEEAQAVQAWKHGRQGIEQMELALGDTKRAARGTADEIRKLTEFAKTQSPWSKGLKELEAQQGILKQEKAEIRAAAKAADAHWQKQIAIAQAAKDTAAATGEIAADLERSGAPGAGLSSLVASFGSAITGAFSLHKALGMIKDEYDALIARGKAAAGFQVGLGGAQRAMIRNLSGQELSVKEVDLAARTISADTGADLTAVYQAISSGLSARGSLSEKQAVETAAKTFALDPSFAQDEASLLTGAALDMRKAFGGNAEQALGAMLTAQQTARIVSTQDFAQNAAPALLGLHAFGDDFREASALFSTISQQSADVTGRRSGSAAIRFAQQLREATPFIEGASTEERRQWLVSGDAEAEKIRRRLLGTMRQEFEKSETQEAAEADPTRKAELHAEAKQFLAMIELLERGSDTFRAFEQTFAATPEYDKAGGRYQQNLTLQRQLGLQKTVRQAEIGRAALQTALQEESRAVVSQVRTDLAALLEQAGSFGRDWLVATTGAETGALSRLSQIEGGLEIGGTAPGQKRHKSREIRAIDEAIGVVEMRLELARSKGQYEDQEFAKTREALEGYLATQRKERERLVRDAEAVAPAPPAPVPSSELVDPNRLNRFARAAKAARENAEKGERDKAAKKQQAATAKTDATRKKLQAKADSVDKQVGTLQKELAKDDADIEELRKELEVKRQVNAAGTNTRPNAWGASNTKGRRATAPRGKSQATRLREQESVRRLELRITEKEKERAEHEAALNKKLDEQTAVQKEQTDVLKQIAANTTKGAAPPPQRAPAAIGGN